MIKNGQVQIKRILPFWAPLPVETRAIFGQVVRVAQKALARLYSKNKIGKTGNAKYNGRERSEHIKIFTMNGGIV